MSLPSFSPRSVSRPLMIAGWLAMLLGRHSASAQTPIPDGSDRHPSDYRYPVWTHQAPVHYLLRQDDRRTLPTNIMCRLQSIVVPRIEFRRTSLRDAVEFLRQESRRLDPDPDPDARGVNIFLRLPKHLPPVDTFVESVPGLPLSLTPSAANESLAAVADKTPITITMERMPLLEALKYVASQAGMKVQIEPYAVCIVPQSYAVPAFVTADYRVPSELLGLPADSSEASDRDMSGDVVTIQRIDMKTWLESKGVSFPPGASATYLPTTRKLVVRNTQENLDKIVSVISSALKPIAPTPANP